MIYMLFSEGEFPTFPLWLAPHSSLPCPLLPCFSQLVSFHLFPCDWPLTAHCHALCWPALHSKWVSEVPHKISTWFPFYLCILPSKYICRVYVLFSMIFTLSCSPLLPNTCNWLLLCAFVGWRSFAAVLWHCPTINATAGIIPICYNPQLLHHVTLLLRFLVNFKPSGLVSVCFYILCHH